MLRYSNYNAHKVLTRFTACPSNVNTCIMHNIILHSTVDHCSTSNLSKSDNKTYRAKLPINVYYKTLFFWSQFVTTQFTQCTVLHVRWYSITTQVNVHQWSRISKILECSIYISIIWYSLPLQCLSFCLQITFLQPLTPWKRVSVNGLSKRWSVNIALTFYIG